MKKILIGLGCVVALVVVAAVVVPAFVPVEVYKKELLTRIEESTGRQARIDGDFAFSILPRVEFIAGKVSLGNAQGGKAETMMSLERLTVRVAVIPLLSGNLEVDTLVLEKPVINLEVDKAGRPNWQFAAAGASAPKPSAPAAESSGMGLAGLRLDDVRLVDGRVSYADARTGAAHRIDDVDLEVSLPSLDSPMKAAGSLVWNKERVTLALGLSRPNAFLAGGATDIEAGLTAAPVNLSFKGSASAGRTQAAQGAVDLDVPSVRKLAAWAGSPLDAPGSGLGPLRITGTLDMKGKLVAFRDARLSLDDIKGAGDLSFDGSRARPFIKAALKLGMLDLNPYLPPEEPSGRPAAGGKAGPSDWSDEPIDLKALNDLNAELDLGVDGLAIRKIKVGESSLMVRLRDGVLVTDLTKLAMYGGNGRATVTTNAKGPVPSVTVDFALADFQANPFLTDVMDFERLEGTAHADAKVSTRGRSQREMISALSGGGKVQFLNGAIRGINLAAMARNVTSAFLDSGAGAPQKTDFSEITGTYRIAGGIVTNDDLQMLAPLMRLTGKGQVDLPKRQVNYRLEPKLVATTEGQGGAAGAKGITVPVIIKGPFHDLSYGPDLSGAVEGLAREPGKALDSLKGLIPGQGSGGSGTEKPADEPSSQPSGPLDGLKDLFGR